MFRQEETQPEDDKRSDGNLQSDETRQNGDYASADSESVNELLDEGNAFEAGIVAGVENAADPDVAEVTTKEVLEDDVPEEYLYDDNNDTREIPTQQQLRFR